LLSLMEISCAVMLMDRMTANVDIILSILV
jgi:hypothetical protein